MQKSPLPASPFLTHQTHSFSGPSYYYVPDYMCLWPHLLELAPHWLSFLFYSFIHHFSYPSIHWSILDLLIICCLSIRLVEPQVIEFGVCLYTNNIVNKWIHILLILIMLELEEEWQDHVLQQHSLRFVITDTHDTLIWLSHDYQVLKDQWRSRMNLLMSIFIGICWYHWMGSFRYCWSDAMSKRNTIYGKRNVRYNYNYYLISLNSGVHALTIDIHTYHSLFRDWI